MKLNRKDPLIAELIKALEIGSEGYTDRQLETEISLAKFENRTLAFEVYSKELEKRKNYDEIAARKNQRR